MTPEPLLREGEERDVQESQVMPYCVDAAV